MTLGAKLTVYLWLFSLVPLGVVSWLAYVSSHDSLQEVIGSGLEQTAYQATNKIDRLLFFVKEDVTSWAASEIVRSANSEDARQGISAFLAKVKRQYGVYSALYCIDARGNIVASSNSDTGIRNVSDEDWYRDMLGRKETVVHGLQYDSNDYVFSIEISAPIFDGEIPGKVIGFLSARFNWSELNDLIADISIAGRLQDEQGYAVLLDKSGYVISGPDFLFEESETIDQLSSRNFVRDGWQSASLALSGSTGQLAEETSEGRHFLVGYSSTRGYRSLPGLGWAMLVVQDHAMAFAPIYDLRKDSLFIIGFVIFLSAITASIVSTKFTQPIRYLTTAAGAFERGNYDYDISIHSRDEIGILADALRAMIKAIKTAEAKVQKLAYYDSLTGLGNRAYLRQRIIQSIKAARRNDRKFAILFFDLDGFKDINDSLGHQAGDELLQAVSDRLQTVLREVDFAARLGGDEFCVLLEDITDKYAAGKVAKKCLDAIAAPIVIANRNLQPSASVGITIFPENGEDYESLLQTADSAMYAAKDAGKQRYAFYTPDLTITAGRRLTLEHDLRRSVRLGEFELLYQPQVALGDGRLVGVEALVRWQHPTRGMLPPDEFIQVAERIGLIEELGEWVLHTACQQAVVWCEAGLPQFRVAVNISGLHFRDGRIVNAVREALQETGLEPARLEVEITETAVQTSEETLITFRHLKELGVNIAIDDFGTGYSCLASLKHLPLDCLKVDQAFIRDFLDDPDYSVIVATIIGMGRAMRLTVVAEGVETIEQVRYLSGIGCDVAQGYFFSRPVSADQIPRLVSSNFLQNVSQGTIVTLSHS